jgi:hypothetical protein
MELITGIFSYCRIFYNKNVGIAIKQSKLFFYLGRQVQSAVLLVIE